MELYSIDIGGSSIKHAMVTVEGTKAEITDRLPTIYLESRSFSELQKKIISATETIAQKTKTPINIAISTTGGVSRSGLVWGAGHFTNYVDVEWQDILKSALPTLVNKVEVINDGKASTWAEYQSIGIGTEVFVHFVIGSGIGGGIVFNDRLVYGDQETAGALGHMKVGGESDLVCSCGRRNCVETLASSKAISYSFGKFIENDSKNINSLPTFEDIVFAAREGNLDAIRAFEVAGEWLGVAISNVINVLNPHYITVGGGVILASAGLRETDGGPYLASAISSARELAFADVAEETIIRSASTGNDGGLLGAALHFESTASHNV